MRAGLALIANCLFHQEMKFNAGRMREASTKRAFRILSSWPAAIALAASCLVLQPGIMEFDERIIFQFSSTLVKAHFQWGDFTALMGKDALYPVLNHEFALFLLQVAVYWPYWLLSHVIPGLTNTTIQQFCMALIFNMPIWAAVWLGWKLLRDAKVGEAHSILVLAGVFGGSYATSVLPGGRLINLESLLIVSQIYILGRERTTAIAILMGLLGGYLTALRPYDAAAAAALLFLFLPDRKRVSSLLLFWVAGFVFALAIGFASKFLLSLPNRAYASEISPAIGSAVFFQVYMSRWAGALFSFAYGLPWTMPFLFFAAASPDRSALPAKSAAILAVMGFTLLFPYWAGEAGIAGNRYLFPQLLLFLPEMGLGFQRLAMRYRMLVLAVPVSVILFLPSIAFRHNVTYDYAVGETSSALLHPIVGRSLAPLGSAVSLPLWNPVTQPGLFAWWQLSALMQHKPMLLPAGASHVSLDPWLVPPNGLLPRLFYLKNVDLAALPDARVAAAGRFVAQLPNWMPDMVFALSVLVTVFWICLLTLAICAVF